MRKINNKAIAKSLGISVAKVNSISRSATVLNLLSAPLTAGEIADKMNIHVTVARALVYEHIRRGRVKITGKRKYGTRWQYEYKAEEDKKKRFNNNVKHPKCISLHAADWKSIRDLIPDFTSYSKAVKLLIDKVK